MNNIVIYDHTWMIKNQTLGKLMYLRHTWSALLREEIVSPGRSQDTTIFQNFLYNIQLEPFPWTKNRPYGQNTKSCVSQCTHYIAKPWNILVVKNTPGSPSPCLLWARTHILGRIGVTKGSFGCGTKIEGIIYEVGIK